MNIKDQLISSGWSIKADFFEGNRQQRIEDVKKQLLDVSISRFLSLLFSS